MKQKQDADNNEYSKNKELLEIKTSIAKIFKRHLKQENVLKLISHQGNAN